MRIIKTTLKAIGLFALITSSIATGIWAADELRELDAFIEESQALEQEWQKMRRDMCASSVFENMEPASQEMYECEQIQ